MDLLLLYTTAIFLLADIVNSSPVEGKINLDLWARVGDSPENSENVIVILNPSPSPDSDIIEPETNTHSKKDRPLTETKDFRCAGIKALKKALVDIHSKSAARVFAALAHLGARFSCFWINNTCYIYSATRGILKVLAELSVVAKIIPDIICNIPDNPKKGSFVNECTGEEMEMIQWSVKRMKADKLWEEGITGKGITVAVIDTGIYREHTALKQNMRPFYNWFDPKNLTYAPNDASALFSHGTSVTACAVGRNGIGVAKDAEWIGCMALDWEGSGTLATTTECLQWVLCPTLPDGSAEDCCMAPDIVNLSYGISKEQAEHFREVTEPLLENLRKAGIIIVAAVGNNGDIEPYCGEVDYPGISPNVISVGATNTTDYFAWFTGIGPGQNEDDIQPFICAPGEDITTAAFRNITETDPNCYQTVLGSSVSSPYVAGAIALLLSWDYSLSFEEIKDILKDGAVQLPTFDAHDYSLPYCKNDYRFNHHIFPNNIYGHGMVDILGSYEKAKASRRGEYGSKK